MARIFICYRRENAEQYAGPIHEFLAMRCGGIFFDRVSLEPGKKWPDEIRRELEECEFLLVIVGKDWHKAAYSDSGKLRLDDPEDWVRREIETGLSQPGTTVIPVLVGPGVTPPKAEWLPDSLKELFNRQIFSLTDGDFLKQLRELALLVRCGGTDGTEAKAEAAPTGRLAHQLCDRKDQKRAAEAVSRSSGRAPCAFFVHGGQLQRHSSLIQYVEECLKRKGQRKVLSSSTPFDWRCEDAAKEEIEVRPRVLEMLDEGNPVASGTAEDLHRALRRHRGYDFVSVRHFILASKTKPCAVEAIRAHLGWWDEVEIGPEDPVPVLFFSVIYNSWFERWRWRRTLREMGGYRHVQTHLLEELVDVDRDDVWAWFEERGEPAEQHVKQLFGGKKHLPMADVEDYLKKHSLRRRT